MIKRAVLNPVLANCLMMLIVGAGAFAVMNMHRDSFPAFSFGKVLVAVPYPGASPGEIEESIVLKVEEAVQGIEGIERVQSSASEGLGAVTIELKQDADVQRVISEVRTAVDQLDFPDQAEKPVTTELKFRVPVIYLAVYGDVQERALKELAEDLRRDLLEQPDISQVALTGTRNYEIQVAVGAEDLRSVGLTMSDVVRRIREESLEMPAGSIRDEGSEISIRVDSKRRTAEDYARIVLASTPDGRQILLGDVATIEDDYVEDVVRNRFWRQGDPPGGTPCVQLVVGKADDEDLFDIARQVRERVEARRAELPAGVEAEVWFDTQPIVEERLDLLYENLVQGLVLVFVFLLALLGFRLAFWVCLGIPVSFLGSLAVLYFWGGTLNMVSTFAFILVLGMLVDDAIVIGENIYCHYQRGASSVAAAYRGTREVALPVAASSLTTVVSFAPILFMGGQMGKLMQVTPVIVCGALAVSYLESVLILPNHLAHSLPERKAGAAGAPTWFQRLQGWIDGFFEWFVRRVYGPVLRMCLRWKGLTIGASVGVFLITLALVAGGVVEFVVMPPVDADFILCRFELPPGTTVERTGEVAAQIEATVANLNAEFGGDLVERAGTTIGGTSGLDAETGSHMGEVFLRLESAGHGRPLTSDEILAEWRERIGDLPGVDRMSFKSLDIDPAGHPIQIRFYGAELEVLAEAAEELGRKLEDYPGVVDIQDDYRLGKREIVFRLRERAAIHGVTARGLATQLREGYFGVEAATVQRGREDVEVRVRFPAGDRRSIGDVEDLWITSARGERIPLDLVAETVQGRSLVAIRRVDRQRAVTVSAGVDLRRNNAEKVVGDLEATFLPELAERHGISYSFGGQREQMGKSTESLGYGMIAAVALIYMILAQTFRSWIQPLIIMSTIPLSFFGAIVGHLVMGMDISILSMVAFVGLAGIVVNDSIVLVESVNDGLARGDRLGVALEESSLGRFRPIFLTSATTFLALLPMLLEKSGHAKILIPMAITIAFGVLFETLFVLLLIPAVLSAVNDLRRGWRWMRTGVFPPAEDVEPAVQRARSIEEEELAPERVLEVAEVVASLAPAPEAPRPAAAAAEVVAPLAPPAPIRPVRGGLTREFTAPGMVTRIVRRAGGAGELVEAARERAQAGDVEGAIAQYLAALRFEPDRGEFYLEIGMLRSGLGDWRGAAASYERAVECDPDNPDFLEMRGWAYLHAGEYALAVADFDRRLEVEPENLILRQGRATAWLALGDPGRALADLDAAIAVAPLPNLHYLRGNAHRDRRDHEAAIADYDRTIARDAGHARAHLQRGICRLALGRPAEALEDLEQAYALDEQLVEALFHQGKALVAADRPDEAVALFGRFLAARPESTYAYHARAEAHHRRRDHASAVRDFKRFLEHHPSTRHRPVILRYLREHDRVAG